jgi:hypothetical protein
MVANRHQLISKIALQAGITYGDAQAALDAFDDCMRPAPNVNTAEFMSSPDNVFVDLPIWQQDSVKGGRQRAYGQGKHRNAKHR